MNNTSSIQIFRFKIFKISNSQYWYNFNVLKIYLSHIRHNIMTIIKYNNSILVNQLIQLITG